MHLQDFVREAGTANSARCTHRSLYVPCGVSYLCNQSPGKGNRLQNSLRQHLVSFAMNTCVHSMNEHKQNEMAKMDDLFGRSLEFSEE